MSFIHFSIKQLLNCFAKFKKNKILHFNWALKTLSMFKITSQVFISHYFTFVHKYLCFHVLFVDLFIFEGVGALYFDFKVYNNEAYYSKSSSVLFLARSKFYFYEWDICPIFGSRNQELNQSEWATVYPPLSYIPTTGRA